jgi:hypothetical protein
MFKPHSLKEAFSFARMRDDQITRQQKFTHNSQFIPQLDFPAQTKTTPASRMKRLTWDEMQRRRAQGLCFNCDEKFNIGYKCQGPHLLLLEMSYNSNDEEETNEETIIESSVT